MVDPFVRPTSIDPADLDAKFEDVSIDQGALSATLAADIAAAKNRANHSGVDPASAVRFSDGTSLESWRSQIESAIGAGGGATSPTLDTAPVIAGAGGTDVGDTLTVTAGTVTDYSTNDHVELYSWYAVFGGGAPSLIYYEQQASGVGSSLTLTQSHYGAYIYVVQQARDTTTNLLSNTKSTDTLGPIGATVPSNSVAPSISPTGTQTYDTELTLATGTWADASTYEYRWLANSIVVSGETATTFTPGVNRVGMTISGQVRGVSSLNVTSAWVASSNSITVSGTATVANTVAPDLVGTTGTIYSGFDYVITAGTWTVGGVATAPSARYWEFWLSADAQPYATNTAANYHVDTYQGAGGRVKFPDPLTDDTIRIVEVATFSGVEYRAASEVYTIDPAPAALTANVVTASSSFTQGVAITPYTPVTASGGTAPYTWTSSPLLDTIGLSLNASNGQISGTPTVVSSQQFTITITDSAGSPAQVNGATTISVQGAVTIKSRFRADINFSVQSGTLQCGDTYNAVSTYPDPGTAAGNSGNIDGSPLRMGKFSNIGGVTAIRLAIITGDIQTAGGIRSDVVMGPNNTFADQDTYWMAMRIRIPATVWNRSAGAGVGNYFLIQDLHAQTVGQQTQIGLRNYGGAGNKLNVELFPGTSTIVYQLESYITADTWHNIVIKEKISSSSNGYYHLWIDGTQRVTHNAATHDAVGSYYMKIACYDGNATIPSGGYWWYLRDAFTAMDNGQYTEAQIRAALLT